MMHGQTNITLFKSHPTGAQIMVSVEWLG